MNDTNIVTEVKRHVKFYQSFFNDTCKDVGPINPKNWKFTGENLRLTCDSELQKGALLKLTEIDGHPITVTEP